MQSSLQNILFFLILSAVFSMSLVAHGAGSPSREAAETAPTLHGGAIPIIPLEPGIPGRPLPEETRPIPTNTDFEPQRTMNEVYQERLEEKRSGTTYE